MVDPRIQSAYANISKRKIVSFPEKLTSSLPNDLEELTNSSLPNDLIFYLEDFVDISNEEPQESHEKRYPFLVKKTSRKNIRSEILLSEVINELVSDDDDDTSEENNERDFEDDTLEYSSDDLEEEY
ncbi:5057_t:CDS:1 [Funneliformis mosseae]|uniref:5057_t:CDS:1 n=1 Tax=Funneliformis mosseae TaxID=27381 RepID=A0A9N9N9K6_FUNMO|nr:5057_t:CDS:1 [Funneliformis mosseae]